MNRLFFLLVAFAMGLVSVFAQSDKIVGDYKCEHNGVKSKVRIFKHSDGYRAQVTWVSNLKNEDGTIRTDVKNPDASKSNVRADQIVLIDKVTFDGEDKWKDGKIYDPTSGKEYTVTLYFKDDKTLTVKGSIGPLFKRMYWTKVG